MLKMCMNKKIILHLFYQPRDVINKIFLNMNKITKKKYCLRVVKCLYIYINIRKNLLHYYFLNKVINLIKLKMKNKIFFYFNLMIHQLRDILN